MEKRRKRFSSCAVPLSSVSLAGERGTPLKLEITYTPSDEVLMLRSRISQLEQSHFDLQQQFNRMQLLYMSECQINGELQDLLRQHRIPFRDSIAKYRGMV